ncbi:galactose mutarotase [Streptacidiphilus sp. P02-A3a]|nr:aldose epimerase family protein [Streptacidiphilus sp. P02-A3a]QMU73910.1 galactose mutarotase [Streptacidiphilus sp. P02-A3a]
MRDVFGTLPDGAPVHRWTLDDGAGITAAVLTHGATLQALRVPDRDGRPLNVVLGHPTLPGYLRRGAFFGATVGRYANRIADGRFRLDGRLRTVPLSDRPRRNALHGGTHGFDTRMWQAEPVPVPAPGPGAARGASGVELTLVSPDGDQGFPGALRVSVRYLLTPGRLSIEYRATADAPTVVNLTNHSYFNLAGEGAATVLDHELTLAATHYLPVDRQLQPLGGPEPVHGTPFDFTEPHLLGARIRAADPQLRVAGGYDHCWCLDGGVTAGPRPVAKLRHPASGRQLTLSTTEPGLQLYTGNSLDGSLTGPAGRPYGPHAGIALETQHYPDSPNRPHFPSTELRPGQEYRSTTVLHFAAPGPAEG